MFLLDTNVISELVTPIPSVAVTTFLTKIEPQRLYTSAVCEAEIRFGLARMPAGQRQKDLSSRMQHFLSAFEDRLLAFDRHCAAAFGEIRAAREASGRPMTFADAMIAATAHVRGAVLVTRNVSDFAGVGLDVVDPWLAL